MRKLLSLPFLLLLLSLLPVSGVAHAEGKEKAAPPPARVPEQRLVEIIYADDDRPQTENFHTVYTCWLSKQGTGSEREVYNWARQGGSGTQPGGQENADKCLAIFKALAAPEKLPENPNLVVTIRCFEEGHWLEKRFDVDALPPEISKITEIVCYPGMVFPTIRARREREVVRRLREFCLDLSDQTKSEKLDYAYHQKLEIRCPELGKKLWVSYKADYEFRGLHQNSFHFTTHYYYGELAEDAGAAFLDQLRKLPVEGLESAGEEPRRCYGLIILDDQRRDIRAAADHASRKAWQACVEEFLRQHVPQEKMKTATRDVEGETIKAQEIDFPTLLADPARYDGKRVRLKGYLDGTGWSGYAPMKEDIGKDSLEHSIWLLESSPFADPARISKAGNGMITVEGSFLRFDGGQGGIGSLVAITERLPVVEKGK